jgi:hypothetical protein
LHRHRALAESAARPRQSPRNGTLYLAVGLSAIRVFEHLSRAGATLDQI